MTRVEALMLKLWIGKSASSSSLCTGDGGLSGTVDPSEMKERVETVLEANRACFVCAMGDDSGRLFCFFHACRVVMRGRRPVVVPEEGNRAMSKGRTRFLLGLLPDRWKCWKSSE